MAMNPGKKINRYNFTQIFARAWGKAMTPSNIASGFRTTGVCPFNRKAIKIPGVDDVAEEPSAVLKTFLRPLSWPTSLSSALHILSSQRMRMLRNPSLKKRSGFSRSALKMVLTLPVMTGTTGGYELTTQRNHMTSRSAN